MADLRGIPHVLSLKHMSAADLRDLMRTAKDLKERRQVDLYSPQLQGKVLGMMFETASLRTRLAFEAGMAELGGTTVHLSPAEIGLGKRETFQDIAKVLGTMVHFVAYRTARHERLLKLSEFCEVPLFNAGTDLLAPLQVLADLLTIQERFSRIGELAITFAGPAGPATNTWLEVAAALSITVTVCCPQGQEPDRHLFKAALDNKVALRLQRSLPEAIQGADIVYIEPWPVRDSESPDPALAPWRVTEALLDAKAPGAVIMHPMPARYGHEAEAALLQGERSLMYQQAANALHVNKSLLSLTT